MTRDDLHKRYEPDVQELQERRDRELEKAPLIAPWHDPEVEWRCEAHPDRTWDEGKPTDCGCGAPGVPYKNGKPWDDSRAPISNIRAIARESE